MNPIEWSALFRTLTGEHAGVEVWPDTDAPADGWSYSWIVSRFGEGNARTLATVRTRGDQLERRSYDTEGNNVWFPAD